MEFMLNYASKTFEQGIAFPSERRYKLKCRYQLGLTAKKLYETLQQKTISEVFPDIDFEFGEIVEIDDGLKPYCFYYAGGKGFVPAPHFNSAKIRLENEKGR